MQENGQEILREQQGWMTEYKGRERRKAEERGIIQETAEEFLKDWEEWQEWWQGSEQSVIEDAIEWAEGLQENCSRVGLDELAERVGAAVHNGEDRAQWDREDNPRGDSVSESEGSSDGREEGVQAGGGMDWRGEEEWGKVRYIIGLALDEFEDDSRAVAVEKGLEIMAAGLEEKWGLKGSQGGDTEKTEIGRGGGSGSSAASGGPSAHSTASPCCEQMEEEEGASKEVLQHHSVDGMREMVQEAMAWWGSRINRLVMQGGLRRWEWCTRQSVQQGIRARRAVVGGGTHRSAVLRASIKKLGARRNFEDRLLGDWLRMQQELVDAAKEDGQGLTVGLQYSSAALGIMVDEAECIMDRGGLDNRSRSAWGKRAYEMQEIYAMRFPDSVRVQEFALEVAAQKKQRTKEESNQFWIHESPFYDSDSSRDSTDDSDEVYRRQEERDIKREWLAHEDVVKTELSKGIMVDIGDGQYAHASDFTHGDHPAGPPELWGAPGYDEEEYWPEYM